MRILIISEILLPHIGGSEIRWNEIASRLVRRGHDVSFITGRGDITSSIISYDDYPDFEKRNGYKIFRPFLYKSREIYPGTRSVMNAIRLGFYSSIYYRKLNKLIDKFDIIDVNTFPHIHIPLFKLIGSSKFILTWHEVLGDYWFKFQGIGKMGKYLENINAKLGTFHISVSERTTHRLARLTDKPIYTVSNGVSDIFYNIENNSPEYPVFVYVGRPTADKNLFLLIKSFRQVKKQFPRAELHIVGNVLYKIDRAGIYYHGVVNHKELVKIYSYSNIYVSSSKREGDGISVKEALVSNLPVILLNTKDNAASDIIINYKHGIITDELNFPKAMIEAYDMRDELVENIKKIRARFKWDKRIDKIERIYNTFQNY